MKAAGDVSTLLLKPIFTIIDKSYNCEEARFIRTLNSRNLGRLTDMLKRTRKVEQTVNVGVERRGK